MSDKHTGGKWEVRSNHQSIWLISDSALGLRSRADVYGMANAKRIVACVNALDGISNVDVVGEMVSVIEELCRGWLSDSELNDCKKRAASILAKMEVT